MSTIHVVVGFDDDGDEDVHEYQSPQASFVTETSGCLVVFFRPNDQWAAYAPGEWKRVRDADRAN